MADKKKDKELPKVERITDKEERKKALAAAVAFIEKEFGKGAIMRMTDSQKVEDVEVVSTGSLGLDIALGVGGLPRGRVVEIYGPESSGKTTLTLHVIAQMQKIGGTCAFIDAEHALDVQYAEKLGVKLDELYLSQPDTGEQALEITDSLVRSGAVDLVVIDSVAALTPKNEIEGDMGEAMPGLQARLMSQALRKLTSSINRSKTLVIFINQIRMKIGVTYGSPEVTAGGNALKFYSSVRIDIRRKQSLKKGDDVFGSETKVKVVKNKVAPPFKEATFDILYGEGISYEGELLDIGSDLNIVDKSGAWYAYEGTKIGQGRDNARAWLRENPDKALEIENKIRAIKGLKNKTMSLDVPKDAKAAAKDEKPAKDDKKATKKTAAKPAAKEVPAEAAPVEEIVREPVDAPADETTIDPAELYE